MLLAGNPLETDAAGLPAIGETGRTMRSTLLSEKVRPNEDHCMMTESCSSKEHANEHLSA